MMRPSSQASEAGVRTETEQVGQAAVAARDRLGPDSPRERTRLGRAVALGAFFDPLTPTAVPVTHALDAIRPAFARVGMLGSR